jgi:hypothetical protein
MAEKRSKSKGPPFKKSTQGMSHYAVCVKNDDYPASLELRKLYQLLADEKSGALGLVRIIDESGEDYLYPAHYFVPVRLPRSVEKAVRLAS